MSIKINIALSLQHATNGVKMAEVSGNTVGECLIHLTEQFPLIKEQLFNEQGKLDPFIDIYVNSESAYPEELAKQVKDGDELSILFLVGGG